MFNTYVIPFRRPEGSLSGHPDQVSRDEHSAAMSVMIRSASAMRHTVYVAFPRSLPCKDGAATKMSTGRHTKFASDESCAIPHPADEVPEYFRYRPISSFEASGHKGRKKIAFVFTLRLITEAVAG